MTYADVAQINGLAIRKDGQAQKNVDQDDQAKAQKVVIFGLEVARKLASTTRCEHTVPWLVKSSSSKQHERAYPIIWSIATAVLGILANIKPVEAQQD